LAKLDTPKQEETTRSALSAIAAGILVIIAGFLVYNYFSKSGEESMQALNKAEEQAEEVPSEGAEQAAHEEKPTNESSTQEEVKGEAATQAGSLWVANDISANSIEGSQYIVKSGDTLWEISEGRYGSGFDWAKIRDANQDSIGFLANGSQALIVPGQVLSLP